MTNFQLGQNSRPRRLLTPERAVLFLPMLAGALLAAIVLMVGFVPLSLQIKEKLDVLKEMETKQLDMPFLQQQIDALRRQKQLKIAQKERLLELVAGTTQLRTFLAKLNELAVQEGVAILKVEPKAVERPAPKTVNPANGDPATPAADATSPPLPPGDPLLAQNLEKRSAALIVQGPFRRIVAFMQQMEQLEVIVITSDLELQLASPNQISRQAGSGLGDLDAATNTTLKLNLSAYGRSTKAQP